MANIEETGGRSNRPTGFGMTVEAPERICPRIPRSSTPPTSRLPMGTIQCLPCLELDGVVAKDVVAHLCRNRRTGREFVAFVCARCLDMGRETRVTCRTFLLPIGKHL